MTSRVQQVVSFLEQYRETRMIKLVTGMRGCGKSSALDVWEERLKLDGVKPDHIIRCNLEDPRMRARHETEALLDLLESLMPEGDGTVYVILDEICECHEFEAVIGVLFARSRLNLTITCSNERPVSSRFREYLTGRCVYLKMMPQAFAEVPLPKRTGFEERLAHVLRYGALPYLNRYRGKAELDEVAPVYLQGLWNTILVKDILTRNRLADSRLTEKLLARIYDHLGENESLRKIAAASAMDGREAAPNTVDSYLSALDESLLVRKMLKYDVFTGDIMKSGYRFYLCDLALGARRYGEYPGDPENAIRNLIALELAGRGLKVYCGRYDGSDFDFVSLRQEKYACWQYAPEIVDGAVPTSVLAALKRVPDDVPRYVITRRELPTHRVKGLDYLTLESFLMGTGREKAANQGTGRKK